MRRMITGKQTDYIEEMSEKVEIDNNVIKVSLPQGSQEASVELRMCGDGYLTFAGKDIANEEAIGFGYDGGDPYVTISGNDVYSSLPVRVDKIQSDSRLILSGESGITLHDPVHFNDTVDFENAIITSTGDMILQFNDDGEDKKFELVDSGEGEVIVKIEELNLILPNLPTFDPEVEGAV